MREAVLRDDDLYGADEVFLTGTTREIMPIVQVDDRKIGLGRCLAPSTHHDGSSRGRSFDRMADRDPYGFHLRVFGRVRACADEIPVAVRVVDAPDRRPELVGLDERQRKRRLLPAVGMRPAIARDGGGRVRSVLQHVVPRIGLAFDDRLNFLPDRNHRVAEPIELLLRLALGRLDHQRAGHRKRHGRSVKAVVHQPLRDVESLRRPADLNRRRSKIISCATVPLGRV